MAETPTGQGSKTTPKKEKEKRNTECYCILCRKVYWKIDTHDHMHCLLHHKELEVVLGSGAFHECHACKVSAMDINEYAKHIATAQHRVKLKKLKCRKSVKALSLEKSLGHEIIAKILERNKALKKDTKKANKKKLKKNKQEANQKNAQEQHNKEQQQRQQTSPREQYNVQPTQTSPKGCVKGLVKNKENRLARRRQEQHTWSGATQTQHPQYQTLPSYLAYQPRPDYSSFRFNRPEHRNFRHQGPVDQQGAFVDPVQSTPSHNKFWDDYSNQHSSATAATEFINDQLPQNGAIIFGKDQGGSRESTRPEQGRQDPCRTRPTASTVKLADRSSDGGTTQDSDVNAMLREIRRTLGIREPCRADREARSLRLSSEASIQREASCSVAQQAGAEKGNPSEDSLSNKQTQPVSHLHAPGTSSQKCSVKNRRDQSTTKTASVQPKEVKLKAAPTIAKQRTLKKPQEKAPRSQVSMQDAPQSDGPSGGKERESQGGASVPRLGSLAQLTTLSRNKAKTTAAEPNLNAARRIRNVGETRKAEGEKEAGLKPTIQKLLCSAGSQRKVNWKEMYQEAHRKKLEKGKGQPRFGIELVNPLPEHDGFTHIEEEDPPLSEGFQWECDLPDTPPPAPLHTASDCPLPSRSEPQTHVPEPPEEDDGSKTMVGNRVKKEMLSAEGQDRCPDGNYSPESNLTMERKRKAGGEVVPVLTLDPIGKKRKAKTSNDQTPVDELLAVSLKEEVLSQSLMEVDTSLLQARDALQLAYTEVQRLLLLKQQFTTEVNSLRAQRIEILQGMKEVYTGAPAEASNTFPHRPLPASVPSPNATSSTKSPAATTTSPSINQPNPNALLQSKLSIKQEPFEGSTERPAGERSTERPASERTTERPASERSTERPASERSTERPASERTTERPASERSTERPASERSTERPASERTTERPAGERSKALVYNGAVRQSPINHVVQTAATIPLTTLLLTPSHPTPAPAIASPPVTVSPSILVTDRSTSPQPPIDPANKQWKQDLVCSPPVTPQVGQKQPAVIQDADEGEDSDCSLEIVVPTSEVIDLDDSDNESLSKASSRVSARLVPSPKPAGVEVTSADPQLSKTGSKAGIPSASSKNINIPPGPIEDDDPSIGSFQSHTGPVHALQVHKGLLYTCSGDYTARAYCLKTRELQAVFEGHTNKVNCLLVSSPVTMLARLYTGSSDQTIRCYSIKSKKCLETIVMPDRVLCLHIGWTILYGGLANGSVISFDLKSLKQLDVFECHGPRGVSCLGTAQEGARRVLLVGSYDSTISVRDAKSGLLLRSLEGHTKTVLCMKVVNDLVFSGSSDTSVHAHNIHTGELIRIYKGHSHAITSVAILGKVMVTACLDKLVRVYELQSHDRLQVYGGHSDMVMCMAIHKSVIYTGCYDGSIQAVKLNLMNNHRCWWHGCSLIFGMAEHLCQHLLRDHTNGKQNNVKCRWKDCDSFFAQRDSVRLELPAHMQKHTEEDSIVEN